MIEVQTTKSIDVAKVIEELDIKSKKRGLEGKAYMVEVNKALLKDAADALKYYFDKETDDGK